jgi:hypothetical protein
MKDRIEMPLFAVDMIVTAVAIALPNKAFALAMASPLGSRMRPKTCMIVPLASLG